jgi:hypothetical protein
MSKQFEAPVLKQLTTTGIISLETYSSTGRTHRTLVWIVVEGNDTYVRSVYGRDSRWYQRITANPQGAIDTNGGHHAFRAIPVTDAASIDRVSNAYRRKYKNDSSLSAILEPPTLQTTLRLEPV